MSFRKNELVLTQSRRYTELVKLCVKVITYIPAHKSKDMTDYGWQLYIIVKDKAVIPTS